MSSGSVKADVVKSNKLRHSPYDKSTRPQANSESALSRSSSSPPTQPKSTSPSPVAPSPDGDENYTTLIIPIIRQVTGTMRPVLIEKFRERYPSFTPRNDFDILMAGSAGLEYQGPEEGIYAWLDGKFATHLQAVGAAAAASVMEAAERAVGAPLAHLTGQKPRDPDTPGVYIRPIPQSTYSIRLFPGALVNKEYCMDFVHTATGEPVNSPFAFELYLTAGSFMTHGPGMRIYSMEESFTWARKPGDDRAPVPAGEEKFLLQDGGKYLLKREGHRDVLFRVPTRFQREAAPPDVDELEFPERIQVL